MSEFEDAIALANRILDRPYADPDDDLALLSRQFLRANERADINDQALGDEIASHPLDGTPILNDIAVRMAKAFVTSAEQEAQSGWRERLKAEIVALCPVCRDATAHAYSDATTPGFFFDTCSKHRALFEEAGR